MNLGSFYHMCRKGISYLPKLRLLEAVVAAGTPNFNPAVVVLVVRPNPNDGAAAVVLVDAPKLLAKVGRDAAGCPPSPKLGAGANEKF